MHVCRRTPWHLDNNNLTLVRNYQLTLLLVLVMLMHLYMFRATRPTKKTPSLKASPITSATQNISRESYMLHKELSGHDLREETPSLKKSPITSATQNISKYSNMLHRELSGHKLRAREHHFSMWEKRRALYVSGVPKEELHSTPSRKTM